MQHPQQQPTSNWEAACMSLMDKDLPPLNHEQEHPGAPGLDHVRVVQQIAPESPPEVSETAGKAVQVDVDVAPQPEPEPQTLNSIFASYRETEADIQRLVSKQKILERDLFGTTFTSSVSLEPIEKIAHSAIETLISQAERLYGGAAGRLSISRDDVLTALGMDGYADSRRSMRNHREESKKEIEELVDLVKLQEYLEATYGGDAGVTQARKQAAATIIQFFNLKDDEAVCRTKSGVTLSMRVYSTKKDYGERKGDYEVHYNCRERGPLMLALETFFQQAGLDALYYHGWSRSDLVSYAFVFSPREKRSAPGMEVTFFKDNWKFKFGPAEAEKLMLFLGEYGQSD